MHEVAAYSARTSTAHTSQNTARAHEPVDRVGEELADDARIWRVYDKIGREDDRERITTWNRGLDNLALFAGLFSAVTTAFIVEAQDDLKPNYAELTFRALNASVAGDRFVPDHFVVPTGARASNCLLVASLMLSLSAALIAIMGKDWIGMYSARPICNPRQWAEMRTYRLRCIERWRMSGVIASAPVLLHISLMLFAAGLVLFVAPDPATQLVTLSLSIAAGALYLVTSLSAVLLASSPFRSPATQAMRGMLVSCFVLLVRPKRNALGSLQEAINSLVAPDLNAFARRRFWGSTSLFWDRGSAAEMRVDLPERIVLRRLQASMSSAPGMLREALRSITIPALFASAEKDDPVLRTRRRITLWERSQVSRWTDLHTDSTPQLVADSLSWLSSASQAPDVLRALVYALGDLETGQRVGPLVSPALRERIRADVRHSWRKADLLMLSRYVLADRNISRTPLLEPVQFEGRIDVDNDPSLRCEDGVAAIVKIEALTDSDIIRRYCPDVVSQPRMIELLFPDLLLSSHGYQHLISLMNCYHRFLTKESLAACERDLLRRIYASSHGRRYRAAVANFYGGRSGLIELLTFLVVNERYPDSRMTRLVDPDAAVELVRHILPICRGEHPCLVYLFGRTHSMNRSVDDGASRLLDWSPYELGWLLSALPLPHYSNYEADDSIGTLVPGDRTTFEYALAHTIILIMSPSRQSSNFVRSCGRQAVSNHTLSARLVYALLCDPHSSLDGEDRMGIVQLALETNALSWLRSELFYDDGRAAYLEINISIARVLQNLLGATTVLQGSLACRLFGLFVFAETMRADSSTIWDLGSFLRSESLLLREPHRAVCIRRLLTALKVIHPFCQLSEDLRSHWDRIGLPGDVEEWSYDTDEALAAFFRPDRSNVICSVQDSGNGVDTGGPTGGVHDAMWWLDASWRERGDRSIRPGSARTFSSLLPRPSTMTMGANDQPPFMRMSNADAGAVRLLESPGLLAAQVRWLLVDYHSGTRVSAEELLRVCPNMRRLHVLASTADFPLISGTHSEALAAVRLFRLDCIGEGPTDGLVDIDCLLGHMPWLRYLSLGYISRSKPLDSIPAEPPAALSYIHRVALERYEVSAVSLHASLPLLGSQDTLRILHITLSRYDSSTARDSFLHALAGVTLRRVEKLTLVNRNPHMPEAAIAGILAACPTLRTLVLNTCAISPDTYDILAVVLSASGPCLSTLLITTTMLLTDLFRTPDIGVLFLHVPRMRRLVLRVVAPSDDAAAVERVRDACQARRISIVIAPR